MHFALSEQCFKGAKDKANELTYKLTKLRQMRSMIKQTTKDQADRKVEKANMRRLLSIIGRSGS